ncbi:ABC transporter substrate-binding protein [Mariprofundus micogutta]|uniref:ABC transporter substrate-binding protein n=1 Tax=Mariprofundus micogutta TaxID=1921010 RepID=UPI00093476E7|nr:ABC transporter substrate-binding protein [Mariprofundus micogutta]
MRLITLTLTCLLLLSCQSAESDRGVLRVGLAQMPITMDPRFATDAASVRVQDFIHRGLLQLDEQFQVQGDLAERWENPAPLLWRFYLKPGVKFSDGSMLKAADVAATLNAVMDAKLTSPLKASFAAIDTVTAEGDSVVVIRLKKPDASLLTRLNLGILPASMAHKPHQARKTVGCGAYKLRSWTESSIVLQRVDTQASVAAIRFSGVKDPVTRILKLTRGELDFVQNDLPPHLLPYIKQQQGLHIQTSPSTTFSYIGLNMQDEMLGDIRIRRALMLALDRRKLKQALFADLPVLAETVLTFSHWASTPLSELKFDRDKAESLLDEAGFKRGEGGLRFTINYRTSTDPTRLRLATAIAAMWQEIGVEVSIESLEWGGFYARIKRGDFQVFSLAWVGITDPDIYRWILHSDMWPPKGANRGRYANDQMDAWLDSAAEAGTQAERKAIYAKVQQQMQHDLVYIPLWYDPVIAVSGPRISGFKPSPDGNLKGLMSVKLSGQGD